MSPSIVSVPNFLSPEQCELIIADAERQGFGVAPVTTGTGFMLLPEVRNNTRLMLDDTEFAERLWQRLNQRVTLDPVDDSAPVGLNERLRYYRYEAGQAFRWHRDGAFIRNHAERSCYTFMVYLNEGFVGGATEFEDRVVVPKVGHALLFEHRLRHQGAEVTHGTKYVLRSDVMFRRTP